MKKIMGGAMLLLCFGLVFGQDNAKPFTKDELLRLLKPAPGKRVEQGDLAGEIAARGIAFPADEKTLEEFRKVSARSFVIDAIKQAAIDATRPKLPLPPAASAAPPPPPPTAKTVLQKEEEQGEPTAADLAKLPLLEQTRYHSLKFLDELPNFIVTQFVTRSVQTPEKKDWQEQDKLEIELTYSTQKGEKLKLVKLNDRPSSMSYESLGGATSTGEFGTMLAGLFAPQSQAQFKEVRKETFKGRPTALFTFAVKKAFSNNTITDKTSGRSITTAYSGTIWVEAETARVLRIEQAAEDFQRGFPVSVAESAVEYDWVKIGEQKYLLPVAAEMLMGSDINRTYSRNVIELKNYKVFETGIKLILEKDPPQ